MTDITWAPDVSEGPVSAVYQAVGAASVCWESMENTGIFQDDKARAVAEGLIAYLRENPL